MPNLIEKYFTSKPVQAYFNTIKRFLPDEQSTSAVGLDVSTGECKLIELKKAKNTYELINWAIEPIHNGDIKATIQKIISKLDAPPSSLYTSVFGKGTLIRYIDMPKMSLDDLKSSFSIEADKYFPFAQNQIYTDCCILDINEKGKTMSVMAAATKKDLVDRRTKLLEDLEMPVEFIGLNPIALANVLNVLGFEEGDDENTESKESGENKGSKDKTKSSVIALFDMGESVSSLTILVDKFPRFTRDIFIGGRDFTKSISNALGISFKEAEELKRVPGKKVKDVLGACETIIMNMIQELRLSMDYFATEKNQEIEKLLLTGGTSLLNGIVESFEKNLEIKVCKWNPLSAITMGPNVSTENMDINSVKLGVALGLALYQYD